MTAESRQALETIRRCVASDNYAVSVHFSQRMMERGLFWPDIQVLLDDPQDVLSGGLDQFERPKWIVSGECSDGFPTAFVCAIETDENGIEFITIYWVD